MGFEDAQRAVLDHWDLDADHLRLDLPDGGGHAHVVAVGTGPPVVLLNGIGLPAAMWAPLMARLPGHRLLAVDLPGFGTSRVGSTSAGTGRRAAVAFLGATLEALAVEDPIVVANSLGSLWSLWLELEQPGTWSRAVHVACPALVLGTSAPVPMRLLSTRLLGPLLARLRPPSPGGVADIARMVGQHPLDPVIADLLLQTQRLPGFDEHFRATLRTLLRLRGPRPRQVVGPDALARIETPTQLVFARDDPMGGPEVGRRMAAAMPNARLAVVPGGHAPWLSAPDEVAEVTTRFLASTAPALPDRTGAEPT